MSGKKPSTAISFQIVRGFRGEMLYLASTHHGNGFRWIADKDQGMKFGDAQEALATAEHTSREWGAKCTVVDNFKAPHVVAHVLARLEVLAVTSVNPLPLTDDQLLAALNPHCADHASFQYDCMDCVDEVQS